MSKPDLAKQLKNVSEKDRKQIEQAQEMLGPDPDTMGFVKNLFWGNFRGGARLPLPRGLAPRRPPAAISLLAELDDYLRNEHPHVEIDQKQEIPDWAIKRLFEHRRHGHDHPAGVRRRRLRHHQLQPRARAHRPDLRLDGRDGLRPPVDRLRGAHALRHRGAEEALPAPHGHRHAQRVLPLASPTSAATPAARRRAARLSDDGEYYILNGEKKWATSGALAGLFTVMAKQKIADPKTGKEKEASPH